MSHIRVVFTGQGPTGLPEDRVVNVFHFEGLSTYADDFDIAIARVANFYNVVAPAAVRAIGEYIAPWVSRDATLTSYNMEAPPERIPFVQPFLLPASIGSGSLPNEVALCLSFEGEPPHTPRRRGRVYIGPICQNADTMTAGSISDDGRPTVQFRADLATAASHLCLLANDVKWVIRSIKPAVNYVPVVSGWVDNAWDTQRRRGQAAGVRNTWVGI